MVILFIASSGAYGSEIPKYRYLHTKLVSASSGFPDDARVPFARCARGESVGPMGGLLRIKVLELGLGVYCGSICPLRYWRRGIWLR